MTSTAAARSPARLLRPPTVRAGVVLVCMLLVGLFVWRDYGASWDEIPQRMIGEANYEYAVNGDPGVHSIDDRQYGPAFELLLVAIERAMPPSNARTVFLTRHLVTFLTFLAGCAAFYALMARLVRPTVALLAMVALFLSPRIFADAFYNSKDLPFLSLAAAGAWTLVGLLDEQQKRWAVAHGVVTGLLIDIRIVGIYLVLLTMGFLVVEAAATRTTPWRRWIGLVALYLGTTTITVIAAWPAIWRSPFKSLGESFARMSHFNWLQPVPFRGESFAPGELPWEYIPFWISVTTPPVYLLAGLAGLVLVVAGILREPRAGWRERRLRRVMILAAWLVGPIVGVIALRSVLYDGWRHLYFVYPALVGLGALAADSAWTAMQRRGGAGTVLLQRGLLLSAAATLVWSAVVMIRLHPYQHLYFNSLLREDRAAMRGRYELDYWGLSMREALEWVAAYDTSTVIPVAASFPPVIYNFGMLPTELRERFILVDPSSTRPYRYWLTAYRFHPDDYPLKKLHAITVDGMEIGAVYLR